MKVQGVKFLEVFSCSLFFFSLSFYSTPTFLPSLFSPCFYFDIVNFQHYYNLTFTMDKCHISCDLLFHLAACKNSSTLPPLFLDKYVLWKPSLFSPLDHADVCCSVSHLSQQRGWGQGESTPAPPASFFSFPSHIGLSLLATGRVSSKDFFYVSKKAQWHNILLMPEMTHSVGRFSAIHRWKLSGKQDPNTSKVKLKRTLFIRTKHNMQIFGEIPFIKLQNNT